MKRAFWTTKAAADLRGIHARIAKDSRFYVTRFVSRIKEKARFATEFPTLGTVVEAWERGDVREMLVDDYRLIYRLRDNNIEVLRVMHGAMDLPDYEDL